MRRYDCQRSEVVAALRRLADLGIALRKPGFGWRFIGAADTTDARAASYRFRLALEPAALMEPGYAADPAWLAEMRAAHERVLRRRWQAADAVPFFEMNAAFHLGLVTFSGNRFFIQATEQQNGLRRLRNYSWRLGPERAAISCRDHLDIIAALEAATRRWPRAASPRICNRPRTSCGPCPRARRPLDPDRPLDRHRRRPVVAPTLSGVEEAETIIVGAGYTGLSTALHLAEMGRSALVLEAEEPGAGASGRNGGQVIPALRHAPDELVQAYGETLGLRLHAFGAGDADYTSR